MTDQGAFPPIPGDGADDAMLLGDATPPAACQFVLETLRLADALEWINEDSGHQISGHQIKDKACGFAVRLDPVPQIVSKLA